MNLENPNPVQAAGPARPPVTTQTFLVPPAGEFLLHKAATSLPTTTTFRWPPFSAFRGGNDQLVQLATLAVILAALVAIVGILAMILIAIRAG